MNEYGSLASFVTFRPLSRPVPCAHRAAPFKASWATTTKELRRELRLHKAQSVVLEVDMREADFRVDGLPRADRRASSPGVRLSFVAEAVRGKPSLMYEAGEFSHWTDNVRALALSLEALRGVNRWGVAGRGEQYAGWKALESGSANVGRGRELIERLGGAANALRATHPDTRKDGFTDQDFRDVQAARGVRA
jgi:hypothetical protein